MNLDSSSFVQYLFCMVQMHETDNRFLSTLVILCYLQMHKNPQKTAFAIYTYGYYHYTYS